MAGYYYNLKLLGLERKLPVVHIDDKKENKDFYIASFVTFDHTELISKCADAFIEILKQKFPVDTLDNFVGIEAKGIPLVGAICQKFGPYVAYSIERKITGDKKFIDCIIIRKSEKSYMEKPLIMEEINSITTEGLQKLVLNGLNAEKIKGKSVYLFDDVVSTGNSLKGAVSLLKKAGANVRFVGAILREGNFDISDIENEINSKIFFLTEERLPIFKTLEEVKEKCNAY